MFAKILGIAGGVSKHFERKLTVLPKCKSRILSTLQHLLFTSFSLVEPRVLVMTRSHVGKWQNADCALPVHMICGLAYDRVKGDMKRSIITVNV